MTETIKLHATRCAICDTEGNAAEVYPANFTPADFNAEVFSARRLPDRIHYRMVRCNSCGLVRSDPVVDGSLLADLYAESTFDYGEEVADLQETYGRYLDALTRYGAQKNSLLEIGCGNGFFLEEALRRGYRSVRGVEPSADAVSAAAAHVRPNIACDMMRPGLFEEGTFDVVCLFQVLDHLPDPSGVLRECFRVLRPGGLVLSFNHDVRAASARLLKDKSPIIDIEHTYLYSNETMRALFAKQGFDVRRVGSALNKYNLRYLVRLLPLPAGIKEPALGLLSKSAVGRIRLSVPLGNQYLIGQKPAAG